MKVHEQTATNLNTDQLFGGRDSKGNVLPEYSDTSVSVFGKRAGPWQLFDTGEFYRGFFVRIEAGKAIFDSRDSKTNVILQRLDLAGHAEPDEIFGLNNQNRKELSRQYILPDLQEFVRKTILGK